MSTFFIRDATPEDTPGIAELYFHVENDRSLDVAGYSEWWQWLHRQNPCGTHKALVATDDAGRIVGHYAIVPFRFRARGEPLAAGFLCQLMVAEEFRTQMVFPQLEIRILKDYPAAGMRFAYGLINRPRVLQAHFAFGFKQLVAFPVLARPLNPHKLVQSVPLKILASLAAPLLKLVRPSMPRNIQVSQIARFDEQWDGFLKRITFPISSVRTAEILNWRFARYAARNYRIFGATENGQPQGYVVVRRMLMKRFDVVAIADLLFDRPDIGKALVRTVLDEAAGADLCSCLINPTSPMAGVLKASLFLKTPESFTLIVHEPKGASLNLAGSDPRDWHLTWFDHDFV